MATAYLEEVNPWEAQVARSDLAAKKLKLDEGLWKILRNPSREVIVHTRTNGRWNSGYIHRIQGATLNRSRASQGWHPLQSQPHP